MPSTSAVSANNSAPVTPDTTALVGIFAQLAKEHHEVAPLLEQIRGNPGTREELWPAVKMLLVAHEKGEVRELFPVLRAKPATRPFADHHDDEARELEDMIDQLDALEITSDAWGEVFAALADTVLAHATEEETEIFPAAQQAIGTAKAVELETPYLDAKAKVAAAI